MFDRIALGIPGLVDRKFALAYYDLDRYWELDDHKWEA